EEKNPGRDSSGVEGTDTACRHLVPAAGSSPPRDMAGPAGARFPVPSDPVVFARPPAIGWSPSGTLTRIPPCRFPLRIPERNGGSCAQDRKQFLADQANRATADFLLALAQAFPHPRTSRGCEGVVR